MDKYIVYCADSYGEKIAFALRGSGKEVLAFCDNSPNKQGMIYQDLPTYGYEECRRLFPEARFVIANSSWTTSYVIAEQLEKDGYVRGDGYDIGLELEAQGILTDDHIKKAVVDFLKTHEIVLYNDMTLCRVFQDYCEKIGAPKPVICRSDAEIGTIRKEHPIAVWIPLLHKFFWVNDGSGYLEKLFDEVKNNGIKSFSRYFYKELIYCEDIVTDPDDNTDRNSLEQRLGVKISKIAIWTVGSTYSGSTLISSILDSHPNILSLEWCDFAMDTWYVMKELSVSEDVAADLSVLLDGYWWSGKSVLKREKEDYIRIFRDYLPSGMRHTERDIFLGIYLAYYELVHHRSASGSMILYSDPHSLGYETKRGLMTWLRNQGFDVVWVQSVRNPVLRLGSRIKESHKNNKDISFYLQDAVIRWGMEETEPLIDEFPVICYRFEDMKLHPREVLSVICDRLGIPWDESLMSTTAGGVTFSFILGTEIQTTGFDPKPVWYPYEEYFNAFDRMRLDIMYREKCRAYGFSYTPETIIPEGWENTHDLFARPWQFEQFITYPDDETRDRFRHRMQLACENLIRMEKEKSLYLKIFGFKEFIQINNLK